MRYLGRRGAHCRRMVARARDCEAATLLLQGTLTSTGFLLRTCGVTTAEGLDFVQSHGPLIWGLAVRGIIQKSLESGQRTLEMSVYTDLLECVNRIRAHNGTGWEALELPLFSTYASFEEVVQRLYELGFDEVLSGGNPDLDILAQVVVDPLRETSWGLGRRERNVRAVSRLAGASREVIHSLLSGGGDQLIARFSPPMPMPVAMRY